jgi:hypothetical protein
MTHYVDCLTCQGPTKDRYFCERCERLMDSHFRVLSQDIVFHGPFLNRYPEDARQVRVIAEHVRERLAQLSLPL